MNTHALTFQNKKNKCGLHLNSRLYFHTTVKTNRPSTLLERRYTSIPKKELELYYQQLNELLVNSNICLLRD